MATRTAAVPQTAATAAAKTAVARADMLPSVMTGMIRELMPDIRNLLPADIPYEQFRAALWLELTGRPRLQECTVPSIRASAIKAATLGVLPGRDCHLLPFKNKFGKFESQCITNYFGLILTLERTGKVARAFAHPVYEGDEFVLDYFASHYKHIPYLVRGTEPGKILFYYGAVILKDGTPHVEPMSLSQIDAIRKRAPAHDQGPWVTDPIEMSRKTALRRVTKYVKLTEQQQQYLDEEEALERNDIPPERHQKNVRDLFGDDADPIDVTPTRPEDRSTRGTPTLWRETLEAHLEVLPAPLKEQCRVALEDAETSESDGFALASAVLDYLDHQEA